MEVVALAGGVGAGKFLRGLVRVIDPAHLTVIVNIGDDATIHGLHIAPDIDSVLYALSGLHDEERGWGRMNETFRATEELRERFQADDAWFNLGDLDLAAHLYRTSQLTAGRPLSDVTATMAARLGIEARILPVTDDAVPTRIECVDEMGTALDLHFQEYWVKRRGADVVKAIRFEGAADARPAPGVVEALAGADAVVLCPSNPAVSIAPVLAIPRVREAVAARRERTTGISPIVGGTPLRGMADKVMPVMGWEVSAAGTARAYEGLLGSFVIDERDRHHATQIERDLGIPVGVTDTIMSDDAKAASLAAFTLDMVRQ